MRPAARVLLAIGGSLLAGVAMSFGQTYLPDGLSSLANSAAPVIALAAAASLGARRSWTMTLLGALAGPLAVVGYYGTSFFRGYGVSTQFVLLWAVAGVLFGSVMGLAMWLLRSGRRPMFLRAVAAGYWPGIASGEAAHGLVRIAETTSVAYWVGEAVIGVAVLMATLWRKVRGLAAAAIAVTASAAIAVILFVVYGGV